MKITSQYSVCLFLLLLLTAHEKVQACSTSLTPPHYIVQDAEVIVRAVAENFIENGQVKFGVTEVIKGTGIAPSLIIKGAASEQDEFNRGTVPYWNTGRSTGGLCHNYKYRKGAEYLLLLKNINGQLTPYWRSLAPVNEQLHAPADDWVRWVKEHLNWVANATQLQKVELTFELFKRENINTDGEVVWRYHFTDSNQEKLVNLARKLELSGYTLVKISQAGNKENSAEYELLITKTEKCTPADLIQANRELDALIAESGVKSYWWNATNIK